MTIRRVVVAVAACAAVLLGSSVTQAQVQTGSITGTVTDTSGAVLPGANVTLNGDRLIGGDQTMVTDTTGAYRFDRLVPGTYNLKFELQGFKTVDRPDVRISAALRRHRSARSSKSAPSPRPSRSPASRPRSTCGRTCSRPS